MRIINTLLLIILLTTSAYCKDNTFPLSLQERGLGGEGFQEILLLDLETILTLASKDNLDIQYEVLNKNIAQAQHIDKIAKFLPSINLTHSITDRNGNAQFFGDNTIPIRLHSKNFTASLDFNIFQGGRVLFGYLASKDNLQAQQEQLSITQQNKLQEIINYYLESQRYINELRSEQARLDTAKLNLQEREISLELGKDIKLSVLLAQQEVIESEARIIKLKGDFYKSSSQLNKLLNIDSNKLIIPENSNNNKQFINNSDTLALYNLIRQAVYNHPSIKKEQALLASNQDLQKQSFAPFLPRVNIRLQDSALGNEYNHLVNDKQGILSVNYELLEHLGGTTIANVLASKHRTRQQYINLQREIKSIEQLVTASLVELQSQEQQLKANHKAYEVSQESERFARERLKAGVGTQYELQISQSNLEDAQSNYYDSLLNYQQAEIALIKNMGLLTVNNVLEGVSL